MKAIGVAELKARLSHYLKRVKHGDEVVVTERGLPIAKLVPLGGNDRGAVRRRALVALGVLRPGSGTARYRRFGVPKGTPAGVLDALLTERAEGR